MVEEFRKNFQELAKRFSEFYTDGGMSLEIDQYDGELSLELIRGYFRKEGYSEVELSKLRCNEVSSKELYNELEIFYKTPGIGYDDNEILFILESLESIVTGRIKLVQSSGDLDCYALTVIANIGTKQQMLKFWWQYD